MLAPFSQKDERVLWKSKIIVSSEESVDDWLWLRVYFRGPGDESFKFDGNCLDMRHGCDGYQYEHFPSGNAFETRALQLKGYNGFPQRLASVGGLCLESSRIARAPSEVSLQPYATPSPP